MTTAKMLARTNRLLEMIAAELRVANKLAVNERASLMGWARLPDFLKEYSVMVKGASGEIAGEIGEFDQSQLARGKIIRPARDGSRVRRYKPPKKRTVSDVEKEIDGMR
jgi:hypothetical protein